MDFYDSSEPSAVTTTHKHFQGGFQIFFEFKIVFEFPTTEQGESILIYTTIL